LLEVVELVLREVVELEVGLLQDQATINKIKMSILIAKEALKLLVAQGGFLGISVREAVTFMVCLEEAGDGLVAVLRLVFINVVLGVTSVAQAADHLTSYLQELF
jgi:hypothetical protein